MRLLRCCQHYVRLVLSVSRRHRRLMVGLSCCWMWWPFRVGSGCSGCVGPAWHALPVRGDLMVGRALAVLGLPLGGACPWGEKRFENWYDRWGKVWKLVRHALFRPGCSVTCTTHHLLHRRALRLSFQSRLCRSYVHPRWWQGPYGPRRCTLVLPMGAPGCCVCSVVRCLRLCPLASRLGSVRGVPRSPSSVSCCASRLRWCVRGCLSVVARGQVGLA